MRHAVVLSLMAFLQASSPGETGFSPLFNGKDLRGWVNVNCAPDTWSIKDGMIHATGRPICELRTTRMYENFILDLEYQHLKAGGNAGVFVWGDALPARGQPFVRAIEVQVLDGRDGANYTSHGDVFAIHGARMTPDRPHPAGWMRSLPSEKRAKPAGEWNHYRITAQNGTVKLAVNGKEVSGGYDVSPRKGYIHLESEGSPVLFRNIQIKELPSSGTLAADQIAREDDGYRTLYTGIDFSGWEYPDGHKGHWVSDDWTITYDGKSEAAEKSLRTQKEYGDVQLIADWRWIDRAPASANACGGVSVPLDPGARVKEWNRVVLKGRGRVCLPHQDARVEFANILIKELTPPAVAAAVRNVERVAARGPFAPDWSSLAKFQVPKWYLDAKFGIFIHWGVYSVPAFGNEWYPRNMYDQRQKTFAHHVKTFGPQATFGYKDFIPKFRAEKFDARRWAALFKAAGARYVVPVAEHHDGFPMYDSQFTEWSAAKMGPNRDVVGELAAAVRAQGMTFGVSSHRVEHWWFYGEGAKIDSDVRDARYAGLYGPAADRGASERQMTPPTQAFLDDWLARTAELVDKYRPQLVWFDWWIAQPALHKHLQTFAAFYYNRGAQWRQGVAINYKKHGGESFPDTAGVLDIERGQLASLRPLFWQTDTSVSKTSWGYVTNHDYKSVDSLIDDLVDIVSKNGCLLLNIGPKPDGTIPEPEERMLREIGRWLAVNGDAIYASRPWRVFGEGPTAVIEGPFADVKRKPFTPADIRFTTRGGALYAIVLAWPESRRVTIRSLARSTPYLKGDIARIDLLGSATPLIWTRDDDGLHVQLPAAAPSDHAFTLRIRSTS